MQIDFSNKITNHCDYCAKKDTYSCSVCNASSNYIDVPSEFLCTTRIGEDYFRLLEEYTKMLHGLGFEIVR